MEKILKSVKLDEELLDIMNSYCEITEELFGNSPSFTHMVTYGIESYLLEKIEDLKLLAKNAVVFSEIGEKIQITLSDYQLEKLKSMENDLIIRHHFKEND